MKIPWLDILKIIIVNFKSVKGLSKSLAKAIVLYVLKLSGPHGFVASLIIEKVIKFGIIEIKDLSQEFKDKVLVKKHKNEIENGNTDKRKELEKNILSGG